MTPNSDGDCFPLLSGRLSVQRRHLRLRSHIKSLSNHQLSTILLPLSLSFPLSLFLSFSLSLFRSFSICHYRLTYRRLSFTDTPTIKPEFCHHHYWSELPA